MTDSNQVALGITVVLDNLNNMDSKVLALVGAGRALLTKEEGEIADLLRTITTKRDQPVIAGKRNL